ncbi:hypothetical protein ACU685_32400, partial [Pseudomonas sp. LF195]
MAIFDPVERVGLAQVHCGRGASPNAVQLRLFCRSELAREKLTGAAFIQETRVIVDVFREQARS